MTSSPALEGKVALLTGAAGMIGSDTALVLAEAGARVVLADIDADGLATTTQRLVDAGHDARGHAADVTDEVQVAALVATVVGELGRIDILDNNAGATGLTGRDGDVVGTERDLWDRSVAVNVVGPMLLCKHVIPVMVRSGGGAIVNISSSQALMGDLQHTAYSAGKAALGSLTRDIATQYGVDGVRCNAIAAGFTVDGRSDRPLPEGLVELMASHSCIPRLGTPRDIADAVAFLVSDQASFITGQTICVDGGVLAHLPTVAAMRAAQPPRKERQ